MPAKQPPSHLNIVFAPVTDIDDDKVVGTFRDHEVHTVKEAAMSERDGDRSVQNPMSQKVICESPDNSSVTNFHLPENAQNRVGRWTHKELNNLKMAMTIFGDQAWRKIQRFLI